MSFYTGTLTELLYASTAAGATLSSWTGETLLNSTATMGTQAVILPNHWLQNQNQVGRGIRVTARGTLSTTSSGPGYTFTLRGGAANNTGSTPILAGTASNTVAANLTNVIWEFTVDMFMQTMAAAGANSTIRSVGTLTVGGLTASAWPIWGGAASPGTVATVDTTIVNYLNLNCACTAGNASNAVTLSQLLVFGLN